MKKILILFFLAFLLFPQKTFAAFSITDVVPSEINSSNDVFTVTVSTSSLQSNPQYLQLALTAVNNPTNLFGITQNNTGEPYPYKSSPTASDLTSTFYHFSHENGSWNGQISGKIDISDDGYIGPGQYDLRLYKYTISSAGYVSSSHVTWSSPMTINVSVSPTPSQITPTPIPTPTPSPTKTPPPKPATPKPTVSSTPSPSPKPTTISVKLSQDFEKSPLPTILPAATASASPTPKPTPKPKKETKILGVSSGDISKLLIGIGFVIIVSSLILAFRSFRKYE